MRYSSEDFTWLQLHKGLGNLILLLNVPVYSQLTFSLAIYIIMKGVLVEANEVD
jgi:hypothetical protein